MEQAAVEMTDMGQPLTGSTPVMKLSMWHVMIVDWRLMNPGEKWSVGAKAFDVTQSWLSTIINSDLFKNYYAERMKTHQEYVSQEIVAKASQTAMKGLGLMQEKMDSEAATLSLNDVSDATEMAMKSLGFGVKQVQAGNKIEMNFGAIDQTALANAREAMKEIGRVNTEAEDAVSLESGVDEIVPTPPRFVQEVEEVAIATASHAPTVSTTTATVSTTATAKPNTPTIVLDTEDEDDDGSDAGVDILRQIFEDTD